MIYRREMSAMFVNFNIYSVADREASSARGKLTCILVEHWFFFPSTRGKKPTGKNNLRCQWWAPLKIFNRVFIEMCKASCLLEATGPLTLIPSFLTNQHRFAVICYLTSYRLLNDKKYRGSVSIDYRETSLRALVFVFNTWGSLATCKSQE